MLKKKKQKEKTMKRKTAPTSLLKKKRTPTTPQMEVTMASQGTGAVPVVARTFTPKVVAILDFLHFYVSAT